MPHSSGGGSHGGGSHGGHSHSHSHGSGSSRHTSRIYFPGSTRYVYYKDKQPVFVFADYDITKKPGPSRYLLLLFYLPFILIFGIGIGQNVIHIPTRLKVDYDASIVIEDNAGVIDDEDELEQTLEKFLDETGIAPSVITVNNEDWETHYVDLETYAYDLYVNHFEDEKHWLLVYSQPRDPDPSFNDWYWEGMQGNDTDKILTDRKCDDFNQDLQKLLTQSTVTPGSAIEQALDDMIPGIMKVSVSWTMIPVWILVVGFLGVHCYFVVFHRSKTSKLYETAIRCNEEVVKQEQCSYCGGVYIVGHHLNCPHCQASVTPHDYTVDDEGRITGILN
ncbi:MAG: TPM domain-containing protein [Clostridiales bacterium]|nr:TPM domain-containing protein [Clostridiales bacterium]